jgi:hypothetical protein
MKSYLKKLLSETSTWRGIIFIMTSLGATLSPEQSESIIVLGLAAGGVIGAFFPDNL